MNNEERQNRLTELFPKEERGFWEKIAHRQQELSEIRLRAGQPVILKINGRELFMNWSGELTEHLQCARMVTQSELQEILLHNCQYSPYAYEEEIRQGFLTVRGGHRIGMVGQVVPDGQGAIQTLKNISGLNIRIAHEMQGVADTLLPRLYKGGRVQNMLILSPPGCGKTTLLRDLIRQLSDGNCYGPGVSVGVVDERGEIAGCYMGVPQNHLGMRTDVLDACPKGRGLMMLIRSMAPDVIAVDEIGGPEDLHSIAHAATCGIGVLATMHGNSLEDLYAKELWEEIYRCFDLFVVLTKRQGMPGFISLVEEKKHAQIVGGHFGINRVFGNGTVLQGAAEPTPVLYEATAKSVVHADE